MKGTVLNLRGVEPEVMKRVKASAAMRGMYISEFVQMVLKKYFAEREAKSVRPNEDQSAAVDAGPRAGAV